VPTSLSSDNSLEATFVPLDCFGLGDFMGGANLGLASSALGNTFTRASPEIVSLLIRRGKFRPAWKDEAVLCLHATVEIHAINAN
jgi:hypothetical protein